MKLSIKIALVQITLLLVISCKSDLPVIEDLSKSEYYLINQDSIQINFPAFVNNKIVVMGFIFTNCPDICPLTTNNMRLIQEQVKKEKISDVEFVALSFDPETDKPFVLRNFVRVRNLDLSNWTFLTGEKKTIYDLLKQAEVFAIPGDSSITPKGEKIIFYVHTDRISLIDQKGRIRKQYSGSKIKIEEIVADINSISN